jgi:hypothetical protein
MGARSKAATTDIGSRPADPTTTIVIRDNRAKCTDLAANGWLRPQFGLTGSVAPQAERNACRCG